MWGLGCFLLSLRIDRGDPDHQNRTRPRARYVLALCAAALSLVRANKKYDGKQAENGGVLLNFENRPGVSLPESW